MKECPLCKTKMEKGKIFYRSGTGEYSGEERNRSCKGEICPNCSFAFGESAFQFEGETFEKWKMAFKNPYLWLACVIFKKYEILKAENKELKSQRPPCSATCYHHQTHPCERCGRINGYLPKVWQNKQQAERIKELEGLLIILKEQGFMAGFDYWQNRIEQTLKEQK